MYPIRGIVQGPGLANGFEGESAYSFLLDKQSWHAGLLYLIVLTGILLDVQSNIGGARMVDMYAPLTNKVSKSRWRVIESGATAWRAYRCAGPEEDKTDPSCRMRQVSTGLSHATASEHQR